MTNTELLAKIKAEIERRWKDYRNSVTPDQPKYRTHYFVGKGEVCEELLSFLSTIESEKPMEQEGLDEEIEKVLREGALSWNISYSDMCFIAEHFYELGCRRTAEKYDEIEYNRQMAEEHLADARKTSPKDLEEAAGEYEKKHTYQRYDGGGLTPEYDATLAEAVIFGAKWQKEQDEKGLSEKIAAAYQLGLADKEKQMMKEAVCYIAQPDITATGNILIPFIRIGYTALSRYGIKVGDKVRIIIVKED